MERGFRARIGFVFILWVAVSAVAWGKRDPWPVESSELKSDPAIVWGELDNGFRYALLPRHQKPDAISMRLMVGVGSLDEDDSERGLSHFVEHMAFEGTKHFKPGELIAFFQRLGMSYGVDVNAFTYHSKTVYHLELPQKDDELVEQGLLLFRDYADGILFTEDRLDTERDVILREKQARESPSTKITQDSFGFAFAGTRLANRHPIGLPEVIETVQRSELQRFYQKWYRPDVMTLVAVGDFDPVAMSKQIENAFGSMEEHRGSPPRRRIGRLDRSRPFRAGSSIVQGIDRYTLEVSRAWMEGGSDRDSFERRRLDAVRTFATSIFNERCRRAIDGMSDNFAYYDRVFNIPYCHLSISSGGEQWWEGFVWLDRMLRQALDYGFTKSEFEYQRKMWLQSIKASEARNVSAEPRMLIDDLVDAIDAGRVYMSPSDYSDQMQSIIESLTLDEVDSSFGDIWQLKGMAYFAAGDFAEPIDRDILKAELKKDRKFLMPPYLEPPVKEFAYDEIGQAGSVAEKGEIESVGAKTYRFSNNVRLTFLHTDNEKDTVRALIRVGGGMLSFQDANPGTHALAMPSLFRSGFGNHNIEDVYSELRSHVASFVFGVEDHDAFSFRVVAPTEGLDEFLKIVAEYLNKPKVDEDAFDLARSKLRQSRELEADGMNEGYRALYRMLYPDQPRFHAPTLDDIVTANVKSVREWVEDPMREGYVEVTIVGDVDEDETVKLVSQTLGALPKRESSKDDYASTRALKVHSYKGKRRIEYENGKGDNAAAVVVWTIQDDISFRESAALYVLSEVLEDRIRERVRQKMGATYAPSVSYVTFPAYDTLRHIRADVDCLKQDADALLDVVLDIASDLTHSDVSEAELKAAVAPMEEGIRQAWRDNGYLLENVLYGAQEYPGIVANALRYKDGILSTITPKEIHDVAKRYLVSDDALAVSIVPAIEQRIAETPDGVAEPLKAGATGN